jgi:hypothetical protein
MPFDPASVTRMERNAIQGIPTERAMRRCCAAHYTTAVHYVSQPAEQNTLLSVSVRWNRRGTGQRFHQFDLPIRPANSPRGFNLLIRPGATFAGSDCLELLRCRLGAFATIVLPWGHPMTPQDWSDIARIFQSTVTPIAITPVAIPIVGLCLAAIIGGLAAYQWGYRSAHRRYNAKESDYPHIESAPEISFIGQQDHFWIVELKAVLNNKGKAPHKVHKFRFDLDAIYADDPIDVSKKWGGQVHFNNEITKGSFVPKGYSYCVIGPQVTSTYTYVARVPDWATFLIFHCSFDYGPGFSHWMRKTVQVPKSTAPLARVDEAASFAGSSIQPGRSSGANASADQTGTAGAADQARPARRLSELHELRDA